VRGVGAGAGAEAVKEEEEVEVEGGPGGTRVTVAGAGGFTAQEWLSQALEASLPLPLGTPETSLPLPLGTPGLGTPARGTPALGPLALPSAAGAGPPTISRGMSTTARAHPASSAPALDSKPQAEDPREVPNGARGVPPSAPVGAGGRDSEGAEYRWQARGPLKGVTWQGSSLYPGLRAAGERRAPGH